MWMQAWTSMQGLNGSPPPYLWTPHDWILFMLTLLLIDRVLFWARELRSWMTAHRDPDSPTTRSQVEDILQEFSISEDLKRKEAVEQVGHMVSELKNSVLLEMRPWKKEFEELTEALKQLAMYERAKSEIMKTLRRRNNE